MNRLRTSQRRCDGTTVRERPCSGAWPRRLHEPVDFVDEGERLPRPRRDEQVALPPLDRQLHGGVRVTLVGAEAADDLAVRGVEERARRPPKLCGPPLMPRAYRSAWVSTF